MPPRPLPRAPRMHVRVGPFTRFKAWWMGLDSADNLARYGDRGLLRTIWLEWKGTLLIFGCAFSFVVGRQQSAQANYILENIELNRRTYYGRDFAPEYVENAPQAVYDGPRGYVHHDEASGLLLNADNKVTSDEPREARRKRLEKVRVTPDMVKDAERLLNSRRYLGQKDSDGVAAS